MLSHCQDCGQPFVDNSHTLTKKFCSGACRVRAWRKTNPQSKTYEAQYFQEHKAELQPKRTANHRRRYQTDLQYRLKDILRTRLRKALQNEQKSGSAVSDLGCSVEDFKKYLESQFLPGMTWENQGKGKGMWNIDHVCPLKSFDLSNPDELKRACHYTNLQPLWEVDHYIKNASE